MEQNTKSPHILNTSATLMGLCFIVLTSLNINSMMEKTIIDELTALAIFIFMVSCILSFLSIRSKRIKSVRFENIADLIFITGLLCLFVVSVLIVFNFV
jgi:uncharacterized membrane protein SirB2